MTREFIEENPNVKRFYVFGAYGVLASFLISFLIFYLIYRPDLAASFALFKSALLHPFTNLTLLKLFILGFMGGLFFLPIPLEIFFFTAISKGLPWPAAFGCLIAGMLISQAINYFIGSRFSTIVFYVFSRSKAYKAKRWFNNYGPYAILLFNVLPFPSPLLSFMLGVAKYSFSRLYLFYIIGNTVKYAVIGLAAHGNFLL